MAAKPPDEVPDEFKEDVAKLHKPLAAILVGKEIPWAAQAALGASGYVTVEDLADRWDTPAARENGPQDLGFRDGENGFNVQTLAFTAMRLLQAVRVAASLVWGGNQGDHPAGQAGPTKAPLEVLCDRRQLEDAYVAIHGTPKPRLEFQESDGYLKKQRRLIAKGELGYIPAKHIVSALPEEGDPSSTHKKITVDGWDREDEEEVRSHPTSRRQLERLHQTFRTTLLMCTAALPQFGNLKVTKAELDDWYDWFYGEDIAGRRPPSSDTTLLFAERNAWRKIHEMVHQGTTLSDALKNIRGDFLFWQREVYEHLNRAPEKGKNKGKAPKVWHTQWEKPKKGGKAPGPRGRPGPSRRARVARGSPPTPPQFHGRTTGLSKIPKGWRTAEIITSTTSARACGRSHNCPVRKDGWVCDRSMRHRHALTFPSDRRPLSVP